MFLLSIVEVNKYFKYEEERICAPTKYAIAQGAAFQSARSSDGEAKCWWWLRSPGANLLCAANVDIHGNVTKYGDRVDYKRTAVRPALWIDLG